MFICCGCCQVEVSATSWSLVQRSPTDCSASMCVIQKPRELGGPGPLGTIVPKTSIQTNISNPTVRLNTVRFRYRLCNFLQEKWDISRFRSYVEPRPTVWFSSSAPMSEEVRHGFCCVCSSAVGACPTLFLM
jgi:hypothetical protein